MRALPISLPLDKIAEFCRRNNIQRLSLFGSVLREDFTPESDLDMLVEFAPEARVGFLDLARMEGELSSITGRAVDLNTKGGISDLFVDEVLIEAMAIYDAA